MSVKKVLAIQGNLKYGYSDAELRTASFALDVVENSNETEQRKDAINKRLYQNFGMFHTMDYDQFDDINRRLSLKLKSRNDLNGIPNPLSDQVISELQKELRIDFVRVIDITRKDNGKYFFILNPEFWKNIRSRNPYVEVLSDHEILALTKFRLYDDYETCLASILLILDTQSQLNRQACENLSELLTEQAIKSGIVIDTKFSKTFDGTCHTKMLDIDGYGTQEENVINKLESIKLDKSAPLKYYSDLFSQLRTKPFHIIKIVN